MSNSVITVEDISKRYVIGHQRSKDDGFRHVIEDAVRAPFKWLRSIRERRRQQKEEFWALKNISFEVKPGDVLGIVGRNGAGKSTLLKILSRITEPTTGRITIDGRVASLLEVGTGFHPELTGRENIYLNGAILGMSRIEIKNKFDEIVAFSEVEKFLDIPVKRYSSGMYVRLAFAVAAHLEPEILIIDEVLAVGDAQFQQKCLGKMHNVSVSGRTVLFVSHNMNAVLTLCNRGMALEKGKVIYYGDINRAVEFYSGGKDLASDVDLTHLTSGSPFGRLLFFAIAGESAAESPVFRAEERMNVKIGFEAYEALGCVHIGVGFTSARGDRTFSIATFLGTNTFSAPKGKSVAVAHFSMPPITPGRYAVDIGFGDRKIGTIQDIYAAAMVEIMETNFLGTTLSHFDGMGLFMVRSSWQAQGL